MLELGAAMRKVVEIVNWAALAVFLISIGVSYRSHPNAVSGTNFLVLFPYASGLLAAYKPFRKPIVVACISVNAIYLLLSSVVVISVLIGWASYPTGTILFYGILGIMPATLNVLYGCKLL